MMENVLMKTLNLKIPDCLGYNFYKIEDDQ